MNILNVFKLYYISWHQKNGTRKYTEFGCLKKHLNKYESILKKSNIEDYISNFNSSMYLDIWEEVCIKKKEYFLDKIYDNISGIVEDASNMLFYLSSKNIEDYYSYTGADFDYDGDNLEPSETKKYKNLLLIAKKLDLILYDYILKEIREQVDSWAKNVPTIKALWNTIKIDDNYKIHPTPQSYMQLELLPHSDPELFSEKNTFYNTLLYNDINKNKVTLKKHIL